MIFSRDFAALFIANLCTVSSFSIFFLFPLFISDHGGDKQDIGLVMGLFALASALCRPWVSQMIDRFGRKRSYCCGCLVMLVLPLCYLLLAGPLSSFYAPLLFLRVLHGIGQAICFTAIFTFIVDLIPAERLNEGIGLFGISGLVGVASGPLLGEMILRHAGYPAYFLAASLCAACALLVQLPVRESVPANALAASPGFFTLLAQPHLLVIAFLALFFGFGLAASGGFVAPLAEQRGMAPVSLYFTLYSAAAVSARLFGGRLTDRLGENRILPWALLVTAVGLFALIPVRSLPELALAGLLAGAGHGFLFPTLNSLAVRGRPYELRGKITGIFTGAIDGGIFIGSVILGVIGERLGLEALFLIAGTVVLAGLALFRFQPPRSLPSK